MNWTLNSSGPALLAKAKRPLSVVFILGVAFLLMWAASMSTASADQHGEEAAFDNNEQCMISTIGYAPDNLNDLTDDQRELIKEQCSNNSRESAAEHEKSVALKQCVIDTVGFLPTDMSDLTPEELQLVGQNCANPGQSNQPQRNSIGQQGQQGPQGGQQGSQGGQNQQGSGIDPVTEECIVRVLGYLPEGPEDMTEEQKIALGQDCFGQNHQSQGPPPQNGGMDEATKQCIIDTLGFMPEGKDELTEDQMIMIGEACFAGERDDGNRREPGQDNSPDEQTLQCITDVLGFLPERPEDLTPEQHSLIRRECFQGEGNLGPRELREEERQCVLDVLGFLPERPEDLTDQQRMDLGRECFSNDQHRPPPTDENTQCIIYVLGYLPAWPGEVSPEQMAMLGEACFTNGRGNGEGRDDGRGDQSDRNEEDEAANQCIIDMLGFLPEHPEDLSYDDKARVGAACFGMNLSNADDLGHSAVECIQGLFGYLPDSPDAMTDAEKALINEECFGENFINDVGEDVGVEDDLAQCLVDVLGYMPTSPDALNNEEKILVARECFGQDIPEGGPSQDEVKNDPSDAAGNGGPRDGNGGGDPRSNNGGGDRDTEALVRCAVEVLGYVPESVATLTDEEKQLIADVCFK